MKTKLKIRFGCAIFLGMCIFGCQLTHKELPIFNPVDVDPQLVDQTLREQTENHIIADFKVINQNGQIITQEDYQDKIYVADFIFTRCPSICPIMTSNMAKVQEVYSHDDVVKFLSLSVTPEIDSVSVLKEYAIRNGVIDAKWNITTGNKRHIYELARKSFFAVVDKGDGGLQDFIHTEKFILVDQKKQIRGFYDGTNDKAIGQLILDIKKLE
jgi:protein SCO1/2